MFEYRAKLVRCVDGDTVELDVDLGFKVTMREKFRLTGIDTPEKNSKVAAERVAAHAATEYLNAR
jgi:micrococcal nuclease